MRRLSAATVNLPARCRTASSLNRPAELIRIGGKSPKLDWMIPATRFAFERFGDQTQPTGGGLPPDFLHMKRELKQSLEITKLTDEFVAVAKTGASYSQMVEWIKTKPQLMSICMIPKSMKFIRRKLDCSAPRGGDRGVRGQSVYSVRGRGEE